jgi:hypothetical protein
MGILSAGRPCRYRLGNALPMSIIEENWSAGLGQADYLLIGGLFEAISVRLEGECGGKLGGVFLNGLRVILRDRLHGGEIALGDYVPTDNANPSYSAG